MHSSLTLLVLTCAFVAPTYSKPFFKSICPHGVPISFGGCSPSTSPAPSVNPFFGTGLSTVGPTVTPVPPTSGPMVTIAPPVVSQPPPVIIGHPPIQQPDYGSQPMIYQPPVTEVQGGIHTPIHTGYPPFKYPTYIPFVPKVNHLIYCKPATYNPLYCPPQYYQQHYPQQYYPQQYYPQQYYPQYNPNSGSQTLNVPLQFPDVGYGSGSSVPPQSGPQTIVHHTISPGSAVSVQSTAVPPTSGPVIATYAPQPCPPGTVYCSTGGSNGYGYGAGGFNGYRYGYPWCHHHISADYSPVTSSSK